MGDVEELPVPREELSLKFNGDGESIFIYYLTGSLALVFLISLFITKSLQRTEPVVTELVHDSNIMEDLVTYLVTIETSIWPGSGCPSGVKVYMQFVGLNSTSQFFQLQSIETSKPILKRGFTDIFLIKLPVSLGPISSVKLILSGLNGQMKWNIRRIELHKPCAHFVYKVPFSILVTERCEPQTHYKVDIVSSGRNVREKLLVYHQWLSQFGNTMRYGAFTAVVHVMCVFTTLTVLLDLTLITYIFLPYGTYEGEFDLVLNSVLVGTFCPAAGYCVLLFLVELILRNVKSEVQLPGNAYFTVYDENKNSNAVCSTTEAVNKYQFIMRPQDFDDPLTWDPKFQSTTNFITNFLGHINSKSFSIFLHSEEYTDNMFETANDLTDSYVPSLNIPRYSGIALNHLLSETSHGNKGSSLYKLIDYDKSCTSLQSAFSLSGAMNSGSDEIIVQCIDGSSSIVTKKSSENVRECCVDSQMFWSQYKHNVNSTTDHQTAYDIGEEFENILRDDAGYGKQKNNLLGNKPDNQKKNLIAAIFHESLTGQARLPKKKRLYDLVNGEMTAETLDEFIVDLSGDMDITEVPSVDQIDEISFPILEDNYDEDDEDDEEDEEDEDLSILNVDDVSSLQKGVAKVSISKELFCEDIQWEQILKSRSRKLVADICKFYRQIRIQVTKGEIVKVLPVIASWFDDVICLITMSCSVKCQSSDLTGLIKQNAVMNLAIYMSGEIIQLAIDQTYKALKFGMMDLPDIVVQSHQIMLAVEEAAYSILYAIHNDLMVIDQLQKITRLNVRRYTSAICTEFLKHNFQLIVYANELTWAYFEIYLIQNLQKHIDTETYGCLMEFVGENLKHESEEMVIIRKLCKAATEEAKCDVWMEYHSEVDLFVDMAVKQEILNGLTRARSKIIQRKNKLDEEYKLLAKPKKSRIQILAEKRKKKKVVKEKDPATKWNLWKKETGSIGVPSYRDLLRHSLHLETIAANLLGLLERLEKRWKRHGLKSKVNGISLLVKSLIYRHYEEEISYGSSKLKDFLQVKRIEHLVKDFLNAIVKDLTQYIIASAVDDYSMGALPGPRNLKLAEEDICIRTDAMKDLVFAELETITEYSIVVDENKLEKDVDLIESTTNLIMKKSSSMLHWAPSVTHQFMSPTRKKSQKSLDVNGDNEKVKKVKTETGRLSTKEDDQSVVVALDAEPSNVSSLKDMATELQLLNLFLRDFTRLEDLRNKCTLEGYFERQNKKRRCIANTILHNIIDSYYIIEEGDDSHTFTKAGLYQIEHDVMGESKKKLPSFLKNIIMGILFVVIVTSLVLVTLVGRQLDTTQIQEYVCYYLISMLQFAFLFEPIRAIAVAWFCTK